MASAELSNNNTASHSKLRAVPRTLSQLGGRAGRGSIGIGSRASTRNRTWASTLRVCRTATMRLMQSNLLCAKQFNQLARKGLNLRPASYKDAALTAELRAKSRIVICDRVGSEG